MSQHEPIRVKTADAQSVRARIKTAQAQIAAFCQRHHIRKLSLFGSVLGDEFGPDSDVDILVEFEPNHVPGFFGIVRLETELAELLHVNSIDLRTPEDLSRYFRDEVLASAEVQYAAR
jgi:predicted nucleotidyltransferase